MTNLKEEIQHAINRNCGENASNTPDFILAEYLTDSLEAWNKATVAREKWYGRHQDMPALVTPASIAAVRSSLDAQIAIDCGRPTPPTPAGAGTETPDVWWTEMQTALKGIDLTFKTPLADALTKYAQVTEKALLAARRQAEADRAEIERLGKYHDDAIAAHGVVWNAVRMAVQAFKWLGAPKLHPSIDKEVQACEEALKLTPKWSTDWAIIGRHDLERLRAQLASADKDRERYKSALEQLKSDCQGTINLYNRNGPQWTSKETGSEYYDASYVVDSNQEKIDLIDAALQPSPSLDHGATETPKPL